MYPNRSAVGPEWRCVSEHESGTLGTQPDAPARGDLDRLLGAVARGEHGAFDLVYGQLRGPIHSQVSAVLRDQAQAEEVTQEALLELWSTAIRYDSAKGSATAWALMIARRRAIDRLRSAAAASAREERHAEPAVQFDQTGDAVEQALDRERLLRCLNQLSDLQREAITLAFYHGHSYSQVASILAAPVGTVKARIRDGLIRLRGCLLSD